MKITNVFLVSYASENDVEGVKLPFKNEQLNKLSEIVKAPSYNRLKNIDNDDKMFDSPTRYRISSAENEETYQFDIMEKVLKNTSEETELLSSKGDIFDEHGELKYTFVVYDAELEEEQGLFVYPLKKSLSIDEKIGVFLKKQIKIGSTDANELKVETIQKGFYLPVSDCVCSFHDVKKEKTKLIRVYRALDFDLIFKTIETKMRYAQNTIDKFIRKKDPLTITKGKLNVDFSKNENGVISKEIMDKINSDDGLINTFARYKGSKKSAVQRIDKKELKDLLKYLKKYIEGDQEVNFGIENLPILEGGVLKVTDSSVPIFAAMIENSIIQKLLDKKIEIPYYKKVEENKKANSTE